jgi:trk system potassium uptake protein TrkA
MTDVQPHAIVVGCGRVGSRLAERLAVSGHSVAVIDQRSAAFNRLGDSSIQRLVGIGYDRQVLLDAGIERATSLAAVTSGDNSNIVVARVARDHFSVPRVLARIYDPRRAAIYERLGISTVASVQWTIEMAIQRLVPNDAGVRWVDPTARVCIVERAVPDRLVGRSVFELEAGGAVRVVAVQRLGSAMLAVGPIVAQDGDVLQLAVRHDEIGQLDAMLAGEKTQ